MVDSLALSLFVRNQTTETTLPSIGADLLAAWAASRTPNLAQTADPGADLNAPAAPWAPGSTFPKSDALVKSALSGAAFFDTAAARHADLGVEGDYARLFATYSGLKTLGALSAALENEKLGALERGRLEAAFARGLKELEAFFGEERFEKVRLALGVRADSAASKLGVKVLSEDYLTAQIHKGSLTETVSGLDPDAAFDIVVTSLGGTTTRVAIDLAELGSLPRSLGVVVSFINTKLALAGVATRLETVNQAPKTTSFILDGRTITNPYAGPPIYALKVDVRSSESIAFEAAATQPAFYVVGETPSGDGRLIKLEDAFATAGEPLLLSRPSATIDALGAALGFIGAGEPYASAPASSFETKSGLLVDDLNDTNVEAALAKAGEATLSLAFADGRTLKVSTAWRAEAEEAWRVRDGESEDVGRLDDLAERLTQLLHEQGVAAGVDAWRDAGTAGVSIFTADGVSVQGLTIGDRTIALENGRDPTGGVDVGLRAGVLARRFETGPLAATGSLFAGSHVFTIVAATGAEIFDIDGGNDGVSAETLMDRLNEEIVERGLRARADLVDQGGSLILRIDAMHEITSVSAEIQETSHAVALAAPGAWADGGLPTAAAGEPYADARRTYSASGGSPLLLPGNDGALDIAITIETPTGDRVVSLSISAAERAADPDPSPGELSAALRARLDAALNAAGVYASSDSLNSITIAEDAGQRLKSVVVNGQTLAYNAAAPAAAGGAFSETRSFSSASIAAATNDEIAALVSDPTVSLTIETVWGARTIGASLQGGDPRDLDAVALRLNEALAAAGYDVGVAATAVSGGAGLRLVSGSSFTVSHVASLSLGGGAVATTLDPIDAAAYADDPVGAARVAERASRGASALLKTPGASPYALPNINNSNWFPGRVFDIALASGAQTFAARASAVGADGSIYVVADTGPGGAQPAKGDRDVALLKYDSAGKLIYQRTLGAVDEAQGFAVAVAADGRVAIAGAVTGALSGADPDKGGADSFVTMFDEDGREAWTARRGAASDDQALALAFAPDGTLVVSGRVKTAFGANVSAGGYDSYVRGYSTTGVELFTRQFGTGLDDSADALVLRDAGGGAIEITTGGVEGSRGILRQFAYSPTAGLNDGPTRDLGAFRNGAKITSLTLDGTALYIGGAVEADKLAVGQPARGAVAGLEGFVARLAADFASTALDRTTYLGSTEDDGVSGIVVADGRVYAAGASTAAIAGAAQTTAKGGFIARLDDAGDVEWLRTFNTIGGALSPTALAVQTDGASALDRLGLPTGALQAADSTLLIDRSALRLGDEFSLAVNSGSLRRIAVTATDTLASLVARIDQAIGSAGDARIVREDGVDRIIITARRGEAVSLLAGRAGKDALGGLGLTAGIVSIKPTPDDPARKGEIRSFGLSLNLADLKVDTAAAAKSAGAKLTAALSILSQAYTALANPASLDKTDKELAREAALNAPLPADVSAKIAAYRVAIARLGGV